MRRLSITLAIVLLAANSLFAQLPPDSVLRRYAAGMLMVGFGIGGILRAVDAKKAGFATWGVLLALAIISIVLGWLIMANPFSVMETAVIIIGASLIYQGMTDIVSTLVVGKRINEWKKSQPQ